MQGIGLPTGCSRSDVEVGSIQARVAKYKRPCDDMFPASSSSGGADTLLRLCPPPHQCLRVFLLLLGNALDWSL